VQADIGADQEQAVFQLLQILWNTIDYMTEVAVFVGPLKALRVGVHPYMDGSKIITPNVSTNNIVTMRVESVIYSVVAGWKGIS
jgi:hypothetical protein